MPTISNTVKTILDRQVLLQEAINRNIVSYSLLAKYLKPEIETELNKKVKESAIMMALRRNAEEIKKSYSKPSFSYYIETIKTDICCILLEESPNLLHKLKGFYSAIDFKKGGILNIIQGNFEVAIITNQKYKEELLDLLHDEKVLDCLQDLVSISLTFSEEFLYTPGVIYDVSRFMAWENINIVDIILTRTEMSIILDKKDFMKGYKTLGRFSEKNGKSNP